MTRRPESPRDILLRSESEAQFQSRILRLCRQQGLKAYHPHNSLRSEWGWPDLVIPQPPVLHIWELKRWNGQPTPEQWEWLSLLQQCTDIDAALIQPQDWDAVIAALAPNLTGEAPSIPNPGRSTVSRYQPPNPGPDGSTRL